MPQDTTILHQIFDPANRANPWPLWAQLRETPVCWQEDGPDDAGAYVVSTYREIEALFHDPRLSSDERNSRQTGGRPVDSDAPYRFINLDPPEHDRLRALAMRHFGPPERPAYLEQLRPEIARIVTTLLDQLQGQRQFDFVERFAYPLPVTVICRILGVPREDEPQFSVWASAVTRESAETTEAARGEREQAPGAWASISPGWSSGTAASPGDDLLSRMATDTGPEGRMTDAQLVATGTLLLIAGHETTVNLLGNGLLTLLRNPEILDRLRNEPGPDPRRGGGDAALRAAGPVPTPDHAGRDRAGGDDHPRGRARHAGDRRRQPRPGALPGPGSLRPGAARQPAPGVRQRYPRCFGAPLARIEAQIAFTELLQRLDQPRLVVDPPPYRPSPLLRGPEHLPIEVEGVRESLR